jgi:hypothetical protein
LAKLKELSIRFLEAKDGNSDISNTGPSDPVLKLTKEFEFIIWKIQDFILEMTYRSMG